jgi:hypothetical protein
MNFNRIQAARPLEARSPCGGGSLQQGGHAAPDGGVTDSHEPGSGKYAKGAFRPAALHDERHGRRCHGDDRGIALDTPQGGIGLTRRRPLTHPRLRASAIVNVQLAIIGAVAGLRHAG